MARHDPVQLPADDTRLALVTEPLPVLEAGARSWQALAHHTPANCIRLLAELKLAAAMPKVATVDRNEFGGTCRREAPDAP